MLGSFYANGWTIYGLKITESKKNLFGFWAAAKAIFHHESEKESGKGTFKQVMIAQLLYVQFRRKKISEILWVSFLFVFVFAAKCECYNSNSSSATSRYSCTDETDPALLFPGLNVVTKNDFFHFAVLTGW